MTNTFSKFSLAVVMPNQQAKTVANVIYAVLGVSKS